MTVSQTHRIAAADGRSLAATVFQPSAGPTLGSVVVSGAIGVRRGYYARFATFLAQRGWCVATFDYRGIGDSRCQPLREEPAGLYEWGRLDLAAVIDHGLDHSPGRPCLVVGHSVGGQIVGLAPNHQRVAAVLSVASQCGYWRLWPNSPRKALLPVLWYLAIPGLTAGLGYFPSRWVGLGEDLPAGVARQWAAWATSRRYLFDSIAEESLEGYKSLAAPWRAYSFSDDFFAPRPTVSALLGLYPAVAGEHRHVEPGAIGERSIGHFGFFHPRFQSSLWRETADWLAEQAAPQGG